MAHDSGQNWTSNPYINIICIDIDIENSLYLRNFSSKTRISGLNLLLWIAT